AEPTTPDSVVPVTPVPIPPPAINATAGAPTAPPLPESPGESVPAAPDPGGLAVNSVPGGMPGDVEPMIAEPAAPETTQQGREIGRLVTAEEMVLAADMGQPLFRVANSKALTAGQRVISLPTSRPVIRLDGKLNVEMVDGGEIVLLPSEPNDPLAIQVMAGRIVLGATDEGGAVSVILRADGVEGRLSLPDATALAALEVTRTDEPIQDPLTRPAPPAVRLWVVSGKLTWSGGGAAESALESPMMVDLAAGPAVAPAPLEAPEWVRNDLTDKLSQQASGMLNRVFDFEREADLILRENAYHRRREVRELAWQSLSWIDDFQPIVAVLNDAELYSEWPELIELLRASVRRGPSTAQAIRDSLGVVYGPRGEELYELLWKYDAKELSGDSARKLVQYLDDPSLPCRVLAFRNLNRITGRGYYYRPEGQDLERRPAVQRWSAWAEQVQAGKTPPADPKTTETVPTPPGALPASSQQ
ncbi:MAG: hypothetical protein ACYC6Y_28215, partial [Thermoguttaceae bacterium]